jgi:Rrf2 family protein
MDVSLRTQYALRALVCLTMRRGEGVVSGRQIAEFGAIPGKYVEQVMHELRQSGFVRSRRGKGGGYVLSREPQAITVLEVVEAVEGSLEGFGRMRGGDPVAPLLAPVWDDVRTSLVEVLGCATIAGIVERVAVDMYHI